MTGDDAGDGDVFVEDFPSEGVAVYLDFDLFEFFVCCCFEALKAICGEAEDAAVGELEEDGSALYPNSDGGGLEFSFVGHYLYCIRSCPRRPCGIRELTF